MISIPGAQLATHEKDRWKAWRNVEKKLRGTINLFKLDSLDIMPPVINGDTASVKMYEFMKFTWTDENGKKIDSAIGIPHEIQATLMNGKWIISNDAYDEGPLSDVRINKYDRINDPAPKNVSNNAPLNVSNANTGAPLITSSIVPNSTYTYDRGAAVSYADSYVYHNTNPVAHQNWEGWYNSIYRNYNSVGGDCANFVSQCLITGNALFYNMWNNVSNAWWYNSQGTTYDTSDDTATTSWTYCPSHYSFWTSHYNSYATTNINTLQAGDLIYYDWTNNGVLDHVAIVVSPNGGRPLINAHNWDVYHVPWDAIKPSGATTKYVVIVGPFS